MNSITIDQVLKNESMTLSQLSEKVGIKISLLSKIKNGGNPITTTTQNKWRETYPNTYLVNGYIKWRELYNEQVNLNYQLKQENKRLKKDNEHILKAVKGFIKVYENEVVKNAR